VTKQDQQRLAWFGGIILAAVILWFLLRGKGVLNTIVQQAGNLTVPGALAIPGLSAPVVNYQAGNYIAGNTTCNFCYSGYQRTVAPTPAPVYNYSYPSPNVYNYVTSTPSRSFYSGLGFVDGSIGRGLEDVSGNG
jgi:hypothetical protein